MHIHICKSRHNTQYTSHTIASSMPTQFINRKQVYNLLYDSDKYMSLYSFQHQGIFGIFALCQVFGQLKCALVFICAYTHTHVHVHLLHIYIYINTYSNWLMHLKHSCLALYVLPLFHDYLFIRTCNTLRSFICHCKLHVYNLCFFLFAYHGHVQFYLFILSG